VDPSLNWHVVAEGERMTEKALRPLEQSGLRVVHDVKARYGNYDHIAVGQAGVFLLETKNLQGIVEIRERVPRLLRRLDPEADTPCNRIRPRALAAAACLKEWTPRLQPDWSLFPPLCSARIAWCSRRHRGTSLSSSAREAAAEAPENGR
jgi:Nuclease-related domain